MEWLIIGLSIALVISLWYNHTLRQELSCYQNTWTKIEEMTDHNQDGDVVIHARKVASLRPPTWQKPETEVERTTRRFKEKYGIKD